MAKPKHNGMRLVPDNTANPMDGMRSKTFNQRARAGENIAPALGQFMPSNKKPTVDAALKAATKKLRIKVK